MRAQALQQSIKAPLNNPSLTKLPLPSFDHTPAGNTDIVLDSEAWWSVDTHIFLCRLMHSTAAAQAGGERVASVLSNAGDVKAAASIATWQMDRISVGISVAVAEAGYS